jgi:hypothetical protein
MSQRFTIDGSDALEVRLERICQDVLFGVQRVVPARKLQAIVLAGGYGRGQGGVLKTNSGDAPYNDLEFYVFIRGNRLWNERKYHAPLNALSEHLSAQAGLHVEFKSDSLSRLACSPISMFSYDLVAQHRLIFGEEGLFENCAHHLEAGKIPLSEATRLLFNRCTGLLLACELLRRESLSAEDADFIGRNLAKAQLALGDAVLTAFGQYHWSVPKRHLRLIKLASSELLPWLEAVQHYHALGIKFKLHPRLTSKTAEEFDAEHREISGLALQIWLWLESHRLNYNFSSVDEYAFSTERKCEGGWPWRNFALNMRTFGPRAALDWLVWRYPRERLFNAMALLLWNCDISKKPKIAMHLQKQLRTPASDWAGLVCAYKKLWPAYG